MSEPMEIPSRYFKHFHCIYCEFHLYDQIQLTWLKRLLLNCNLPLLKRKWDKIDEGRVCVSCKERKRIVVTMLSDGYLEEEIVRIGGFSKEYVKNINRRRAKRNG